MAVPKPSRCWQGMRRHTALEDRYVGMVRAPPSEILIQDRTKIVQQGSLMWAFLVTVRPCIHPCVTVACWLRWHDYFSNNPWKAVRQFLCVDFFFSWKWYDSHRRLMQLHQWHGFIDFITETNRRNRKHIKYNDILLFIRYAGACWNDCYHYLAADSVSSRAWLYLKRWVPVVLRDYIFSTGTGSSKRRSHGI